MNTKENKDELRAEKYLHSLGFESVVYEPLGNVTPDFLLDTKIAVEVRRINSNHIDGSKLINIENLEIAFVKKIKNIIRSFKCSIHQSSARISLTLLQPLTLQNKKTLIRKIKKILSKHIRYISEEKSYTIGELLHITMKPTQREANTYLYESCNGDSLWLEHQLQKNIQAVIDEKNKKIEKNFHLYKEWWLLLVDSIVYGFDEEDFNILNNIDFNKQKFSKVIILSAKGEFQTHEF